MQIFGAQNVSTRQRRKGDGIIDTASLEVTLCPMFVCHMQTRPGKNRIQKLIFDSRKKGEPARNAFDSQRDG